MEVVESIRVEPDEQEVLRLLSRGPAVKDPGEWMVDLVRWALVEAHALCRPRAVYGFFDRGALPDLPEFRSATRVGVCVCTIGPHLEDEVRGLLEKGEMARGVALDAVGSETAEATARWIDERMGEEGSGEDLLPGGRFSPGYGNWGLDGQRLIFDLLDASRVGVRLSSTLMMIPRKSVSFAVNFGSDPEPPRCLTPCSQCGMGDCPYRRD